MEGAWDPVLLLFFLPAHFVCSGFRLKIETDGPQEASFQAAPTPDATKSVEWRRPPVALRLRTLGPLSKKELLCFLLFSGDPKQLGISEAWDLALLMGSTVL